MFKEQSDSQLFSNDEIEGLLSLLSDSSDDNSQALDNSEECEIEEEKSDEDNSKFVPETSQIQSECSIPVLAEDQQQLIPRDKKRKSASITTTKKKKKVKSRINTKAEIEKINSQFTLANKYLTYYISCRNGDAIKFDEFARTVLSTECFVDLFVSSKTNYFGKFHYLQQIPVREWVDAVKNIQNLTPDGIMKVLTFDVITGLSSYQASRSQPPSAPAHSSSSPTAPVSYDPSAKSLYNLPERNRSALMKRDENEISFIAHFTYTGTILTKDSSFINVIEEQEGIERLVSLDNIHEKLHTNTNTNQSNQSHSFAQVKDGFQEFKMHGCIIFRKLPNQRIHKIEFFYEFL